MKKIIPGLTVLLFTGASAHTITGTPVLKGTLKTKLFVNSVKTTCKVKIQNVRNLLEEDSYGNPGYKVWMQVNLSGNDYDRDLRVRFNQYYVLTNMFNMGNTKEVRDFDYFSDEGAILKIKNDGRLKTVTFPMNNQTITCSF